MTYAFRRIPSPQFTSRCVYAVLQPVTFNGPRVLCDPTRTGLSPVTGSVNRQGIEELLSGRNVGWWYGCLGGFDEIILLAQPPIDASGNLSGGRALDAASIATQQHCQRNFGMGLIRIGHKPADARRIRVIVAGAGLAQRSFIATCVVAQATGAIEYRREHALANLWKHIRNIQVALHFGLEILNLFGRVRVLQVIERAAIGESGGDRGELQGRDLDSFPETRHARHAAEGRWLHWE